MKMEKLHKIKVQLLMHDMKCTDSDKMYYVVLAERTRYVKNNMAKLCRAMEEDGREEVYIRGVFKDRTLLDEAFEKYGIVDKQPEPTKEEQEKNQLRCIRNVMNDFSVTVEQAMFMLDIEENKWGRYTELLAANVQIP